MIDEVVINTDEYPIRYRIGHDDIVCTDVHQDSAGNVYISLKMRIDNQSLDQFIDDDDRARIIPFDTYDVIKNLTNKTNSYG